MNTKGFLMALMTLMMCFVSNEAYAYDIAVENADGVKIYYNYFNEGTELEVTYKTTPGSSSYSGSVVIPEEVTFMNRTRKVTYIGYYAFDGCSGLTSVTIPGSVTYIGYYAFYGCRGLTSVTIPNSVTSIGEGAFYSCRGLTSVTIPNSVTSIGGGAFYYCSGLTSVTIGNSVTSIGESAFYYCSGLTSVTIPNSVTSIGNSAFFGCVGLTSIAVENGNTVYDSRDNCSAIINSSTNELIAGCLNTIIPNSVTSIGNWAFRNCRSLTSVTIPNSVTSIGISAFLDCSGLTSVTIPNSVTSIGNSAFGNCTGLTSVTIGSGVTSIGYGTFGGCTSLTSVTIPNSVTSIGNYAFGDCTGLTSITIGNSVTSIGSGAFFGCSGLTSVTIPNSVTSIEAWAFDDCNLESVISLIEEPFAIRGKASDYRTFSLSTFNNATLYVPVGTIDKYKATEGWKDFLFIKEGDEDAVAEVKAMPVLIQRDGQALTIGGAPTGTPIHIYDLGGRLIGNTIAVEGATRVNVAAAADKVVIVKVGEQSAKVRS